MILDPYPTPPSYKYDPVISPVTIGVNVNDPERVEPKDTFSVTTIGGYWNTW